MFIVIEGVDGSGKTVLSKRICEKLGFNYHTQRELAGHLGMDDDTYLKLCSTYRNSVNKSDNEMYWFYAINCLFNIDLSGNAVCDRHLGTLYYWYGNESNRCISDAIYKLCGKPDLTILLDVTQENAKKRVLGRFEERGNASESEVQREINKTLHAPRFISKVTEYCEHFGLKYIRIDTNDKSPDEVCELAIQCIRNT